MYQVMKIVLTSLVLFNVSSISAKKMSEDIVYEKELKRITKHNISCFGKERSLEIKRNLLRNFNESKDLAEKRMSIRIIKLMRTVRDHSKEWFPASKITCERLTKSVCEFESIVEKSGLIKKQLLGCFALRTMPPTSDIKCERLVRQLQKKSWELPYWKVNESPEYQTFPAMPKHWIRNSCGVSFPTLLILSDILEETSR